MYGGYVCDHIHVITAGPPRISTCTTASNFATDRTLNEGFRCATPVIEHPIA